LAGNSGTNPASNFLGTTDAVGLKFKINNVQAGYLDFTGSSNTSFGYQTLLNNIYSYPGGDNNVAFGYQALKENTSGRTNAAFGSISLSKNTTGGLNAAFGTSSLYENLTGNGNAAFGTSSLQSNVSGGYNTGIGQTSLFENTSGSFNAALGFYSGFYNTTKSHRIYLGTFDRTDELGDSTKTAIFAQEDATASNTRVYVNGKFHVPYTASQHNAADSMVVVLPGTGQYGHRAIPSTGISGFGTTNYIPKWSSSTAQTDSRIFDNGTIVSVAGNEILTQIATLGTLYDSTSWSNLSGFTVVGSPTTSVSSNKINVSAGNQSISTTVGTANSAFNQVLKITSYGGTMLEKSRVCLKFKVNVAPGATTYGVAVGTYSINTASSLSNSVAYFNMSTATGTGTVSLLAGTGNTTVAVSTTALSFSQNDYIVLTYERVGNKILAAARNQTTNSSPVTAIYAYDATNSSGVLLPNTSDFSIINLGGAYIVDSLNVTSNETKYANVMFSGDSKFSGYSAGYDVGIPQLFNKYYGGSISCSGQSDRTQDVLNHIAQIIALAPKSVILCIGRNDIAGGVSSGTWQANIASIVSQLEAVGITVRLLDAIYETSVSQAALLTYIHTTYPTKYIGTYDPGNTTGSVAPDNVHPTYLGSKIAVNVIYQSLLLTDNGKYINKKPEGIPDLTSMDSLNSYGTVKVGQITYMPTQRQPSDLIISSGAAIRAAYGATNQENAIVIANSSNAGMDFRTYTGASYPNQTGFRWYGGGASTGDQTKWMDLNGSGVLKLGSGTGDWSGGASGDFMMYYQNKIIGASSTSINDQGNICLFDNTASTTFRNYRDVGAFKFFTSGGVSGSQVQAMTILPSGNVGIGTTSPTQKLQVTGGRFGQAKGANVASAGDLTLGADGNTFHITGTTTINAITTTNWQAGSEIILIFDASVTVKNNTAGGGSTAVFLLAGGADFGATSNDVLKLVYDGTSFYEVSRSVN
jgi:hypothetical protein